MMGDLRSWLEELVFVPLLVDRNFLKVARQSVEVREERFMKAQSFIYAGFNSTAIVMSAHFSFGDEVIG